jgi:hypothetical protein
MDVDWKIVKLPIASAAKIGSCVEVCVGDEAVLVPLFDLRYEGENWFGTIEELLKHFQNLFDADIEKYKYETYEVALADNERPPKTCIVFISEDLTVFMNQYKSKATGEIWAYANVGIACFDEEVDMDQQFRVLPYTDHTEGFVEQDSDSG